MAVNNHEQLSKPFYTEKDGVFKLYKMNFSDDDSGIASEDTSVASAPEFVERYPSLELLQKDSVEKYGVEATKKSN